MNMTIEGNKTSYLLGDEMILSIVTLENNNYVVENKFNKMVGYCKKIDEKNSEYKVTEHYSKGQNGRLYKTKKLLKHNESWFAYILKEMGFLN
ncbi:hypothetical protein H6F38_13940 [Paenibacillus sp. EKM208P]|nr:hypothetical protein H6F38_13940 [Paenibacillus sp. EKM208P]